MSSSSAYDAVAETLFLCTIPGATPSKWVNRFESRYRAVQLVAHDEISQVLHLKTPADGTEPRPIPQLGYLRWPAESRSASLLESQEISPENVHVVRMYHEQPVVCVGKEHLLSAWDTEIDGPVPFNQLDSQGLMDPQQFGPAEDQLPEDAMDAPDVVASGERMALEIVASGAGHTILPASVARVLGRKDVNVFPLEGHHGWDVGLAWLKSLDSELVQDFIGVAKGRKPSSSRSSAVPEQNKGKQAERTSSGKKNQGSRFKKTTTPKRQNQRKSSGRRR